MLFDDGLDTVALIIAFEDGFGISIPDRDAEKIRTAGELCNCISKITGATSTASEQGCLSAAAFYTARQNVGKFFEIDFRVIRPTSKVDEFLPLNQRKKAWRKLTESLGVALPPLEFPQYLGVLPFVPLAVGLLIGIAIHSATLILCSSACFILFIFAIGILEMFFGNSVPYRCQTVGQISSLLMPKVLKSRKPDTKTWTEQEIWQIVRRLVAHCAGVSPKDITKETKLLSL